MLLCPGDFGLQEFPGGSQGHSFGDSNSDSPIRLDSYGQVFGSGRGSEENGAEGSNVDGSSEHIQRIIS